MTCIFLPCSCRGRPAELHRTAEWTRQPRAATLPGFYMSGGVLYGRGGSACVCRDGGSEVMTYDFFLHGVIEHWVVQASNEAWADEGAWGGDVKWSPG